jgi:hypothetical protein
MNITLKHLVIGSEVPSEPVEHWDNFAWFDTATKTIKECKNGSWSVIMNLSFGGYTGNIKHGSDTMHFTDGVLISVTKE